MNVTDSIAYGTLIFTIVSGIAIPFIQRPMLAYDYKDIYEKTGVKNLQYLNITIHNMGFVKLSNIVGAFNVKVVNISSEPFINKDLVVNYTNLRHENGYFKINTLPPQTDLLIIVTLNGSQYTPDSVLPFYLVSDEWRGYSTDYVNFINISALVVVLGGAIGCIYYWRIR
jgi:hypothetical protein